MTRNPSLLLGAAMILLLSASLNACGQEPDRREPPASVAGPSKTTSAQTVAAGRARSPSFEIDARLTGARAGVSESPSFRLELKAR